MAVEDSLQQGRGAEEPASPARLDARYRKPLIGYFERQTGDRAEAEDLAQEVLVRLLHHREASAPEGLSAYVFTVASNLLRDRSRRRAARAADRHVSLDPAPALADAAVRELAADISPADQVLMARQTLTQVVAALRELPQRTREVFVLYRLENLRQAEIARRLGISVSAVEKHVVKATAHLARRVEIGR